MAEPRPSLASASDHELERALRALGREVAFPETPDLAAGVRMRLMAPSPPVRAAAARHWPRRVVWLAAAAAIVLMVSLLALFPEARTAIADRLGLDGVDIRWVDDLPTPAPTPAGASLQLGRAVSLAEAVDEAGFPLLAPTLPAFSQPASVYLRDDPGAMVSFIYPPNADLPPSSVPGVGALLTQFRGGADRALIEKGLRGDEDGESTRLEPVTVDGEQGFWISGAPHAVYFVCYDAGECRQERYRLAGNVLLWEENGVTLRLESALPKDAALTIAESVKPVE